MSRVATTFSDSGQPLFAARAYHQLARMYRDLRQGDDMILAYLLSVESYFQVGDVQFQADILAELATEASYLGNIEASADFYGQSADLNISLGRVQRAADLLFHQGAAYDSLGEWGIALQAFERSISITLAAGNPYAVIAVNRFLATFPRYGDQEKVEALLERITQSVLIAGETQAAAKGFLELGRIRGILQDVSGMSDSLLKAADLYIRLGRLQDAGATLRVMGDLSQQQSLELTTQMWQDNVEGFKRAGNVSLAAGSLLQLGIAYRDQGQTQRAVQVLQESLELHQSLESTEGLADTSFQLALSHEESGSLDQAATHYGRSAILFHDMGRSAEVGQALNRLTIVGDRVEDLELLRQAYKSIADEFRDTALSALAIEALFRIALSYLQAGDLVKSKDVFESTLSLYPKDASTSLGIEGLFRLGLTYHSIGRSDDAQRFLDLSIDELTRAESGNEAGKALAYILAVPPHLPLIMEFQLRLGQVYLDRREFQQSLVPMEVAIRSFTEAGEPEGVIAALEIEFQAYQYLADAPNAAETLKRSAIVADDANLTQDLAKVLGKLQVLWQETEGLQRTAENWAKMVETHQGKVETGLTGRLFYHLGLTHQRVGRQSESFQALERAIQIFEAIDDELGLADSWFELGQTYRSAGDLENAVKCFADSSQLFESLNERQGAARSLFLLGQSYLESGNIPDSISPLRKAAQYYIDIQQFDEATTALSALETAQQQLGNSESTGLRWERIGVLHREVGAVKAAASAFEVSAQAYRRFGNFSDAAASFERSATNYASIGQSVPASKSLGNLVLSLEAAEDPANIGLALRRTAIAFEESGQPNLVAETLFRLGLAERKLGQPNRAVEAAEESLRFYTTLDLSRLGVSQLFRLGLTYDILGETGASDEAIELAIREIILAVSGNEIGAAMAYIYSIPAESLLIADFLFRLGQTYIEEGTIDESIKPLQVSAEAYAYVGRTERETEALGLLSQIP